MWRSPAKEVLRYDEEYQTASRTRKREMESEVLAGFASSRWVAGVEIPPGEEIDYLGYHLDLMNSESNDEEEFLIYLSQLPEFLVVAKEVYGQIRNQDAPEEGDPKEWSDYLEAADLLITRTEQIVADPEACVFQTKPATDSRRSLPPIPRECCH